MRGLHRIRRKLARTAKRLRSSAVILMYHRVVNLPNYAYQIAVTPSHFAEHMDYIRRTCHPLRLTELVDAMEHDRLPRRGVVVTFDDGYVDNLTEAYPILEKTEIPATVFVTAGSIGESCEFWWDDLERILLLRAQLPSEMQLCLHDQHFNFPIGSLPVQQRRTFHRLLHQLLRPLPASEQRRLLCTLAEWAGELPPPRANYRPMRADEVVQLTRSGLVDIGAHTMTHPMLSTLSREAQHAEIASSRKILEDLLGRPVETFAYPYGDLNHDSVAVAQKLGFRAACSTVKGLVQRAANVHLLPRYSVDDWDRKTFEQRLESFFMAS